MNDFVYACIQAIHNMGAVTVVGSPAACLWLAHVNRVNVESLNSIEKIYSIHRMLTLSTLIAWGTQIVSVAGFGVTTYYLKHELPELTGIGLLALVIKMLCSIICLVLALLYFRYASLLSIHIRIKIWKILFVLGLTTLMSAAFLRWYG